MSEQRDIQKELKVMQNGFQGVDDDAWDTLRFANDEISMLNMKLAAEKEAHGQTITRLNALVEKLVGMPSKQVEWLKTVENETFCLPFIIGQMEQLGDLMAHVAAPHPMEAKGEFRTAAKPEEAK